MAVSDALILLNLGVAMRMLPSSVWQKHRRWLVLLLVYVAVETLLHKQMEDAVARLLVLMTATS